MDLRLNQKHIMPMDDFKKNIPKIFCLGNFWCLAISLAHGATLAYARAGIITSQKSILILTAIFSLCSWLGMAFFNKVSRLPDHQRDWVLVLTSVFPAGALASVFSQTSGINPLFLLPFLLYGVFRWMPNMAGQTQPDMECLVTILCQIIALSLLIRTGPYYGAAFALATVLVLGWHVFQARGSMDFSTEKAAVISPIMVLWFFTNGSDQIAAIFPGWSQVLFWAGLVSALIIAAIVTANRFENNLQINRICMGLLAASLVFDINMGPVLATPLEVWDFHWWVHVAPGLDSMYNAMQPFIHYAPIEGAGWATWMPRVWFVWLDGCVAGYQILFAILSVLAHGLFAVTLGYVLWKIGRMKLFEASAAAILITVTNLSLLQACYPFPGGWSISERTSAFFVCVLAFLFYCSAFEDPKKANRPMAFALGALHMFSFFIETLLGLAAITGLLGVMALAPQKIPQKKFILAGGFGTLILMLGFIRPPLYEFFLVQPLALLQSGLEHMDPSGKTNLFAILYRKRILSTLHYSFPLGIMTGFVTLLPFKPWKHTAFIPAFYCFIITFFMFISGGQRYFGDPDGTCSTVHFAGLSSILAIPLLVIAARIAWDLRTQSPLPSWLSKALTSMLIIAVCTTGLFYGKSPGSIRIQLADREFDATAWQGQKHYNAPYNYGLPQVLEYYYAHKNRKALLKGPAPLAIHMQPYSAWKNEPAVLVPIQRTMGFFKLQGYEQ